MSRRITGKLINLKGFEINQRGPACGVLANTCLRDLRKTNSLKLCDQSLSTPDYKVQCTSVVTVIQDCIIIIIVIIIDGGGGSSSSSVSGGSMVVAVVVAVVTVLVVVVAAVVVTVLVVVVW